MRIHIGVLGLGLVSAFVVGGIAAPPSDYGLQTVESYRQANAQGGVQPGILAETPSGSRSSSMPQAPFPQGSPLPSVPSGAESGAPVGVQSMAPQAVSNRFPPVDGFPAAGGGVALPSGVAIGAEPRVPPNQADGTVSFGKSGVVTAERGPEVASAGEIIGFNGFDGSGSQTITLVHTGKMQIAVYHIDRSGQLTLVSSRPIEDDFSFSFNVNAPLPREIRLLGSQVK